LFEHRVQTLLDIYRTSSTSKFQTYVYLRKLILTNISQAQTRFMNMILIRENGENYGIQFLCDRGAHEIH